MEKVFLTICFTFLLIACSPEEPIDLSKIKRNKPTSYYLKEYLENNDLIQSFEYDSVNLTYMTQYSGSRESTIQFVYRPDGVVDSAYIRQRYFPRDLYFVYNDSLIVEFEVWNSDILRQRVIFDRDEEGRIIRMTRFSLTYGLILDVFFEWENQNISRYESTFYADLDPETFVYEFKYDQFRNPYASAFEKVGFNFVDYMPISTNNWTELLIYKKNDSSGSSVLFSNKFSYGGSYPFAKESVQIEGKNRFEIYAEYKY